MTFTTLVLSAARWAPRRPMAMSPGAGVVHAFLTPLPSENAVLRHRDHVGRLSGSYRFSSSARCRSSLESSTNVNEQIDITTATNTTSTATKNNKEKKSLKSGREKRRKFIGLAKAVDRGNSPNTYSPGGKDGTNFVAKSGLPDVTKSFCVLGIESSCDDTGGEEVFTLWKMYFVSFAMLY